MNNVVACTITEVATNRNCLIRLYMVNKPTEPGKGDWDWLGGNFKVSTVDSGFWFHSAKSDKNMLIGHHLPSHPGSYFFDYNLYSIPDNFLDTGPGNPIHGKGVIQLTGADITWSIWYRTASINERL